MYENIQNILLEFARAFGNTRETVFEVKFDLDPDGHGKFWGKVLDFQQVQALQAAVFSLYPAAGMDFSDIKILRTQQNQHMVVNTNLTGLYAAPSFLSNLTTQLIYGTALTLLEQTDLWGFVRLQDGYLGWTYLPYLTAEKPPPVSHRICAPVAVLYRENDSASAINTRILAGSPVKLLKLDSGWALIQAYETGWLPQKSIREITEGAVDIAKRRQQIVADALTMIGAPYLLGGTSVNGIDCSGLTQFIYTLNGITIRRDADMQFQDGKKQEPSFQPGDLVFFKGSSDTDRLVSHVGISLGGWEILHSSRHRNGVYIDNILEFDHLKEQLFSSCSYFD